MRIHSATCALPRSYPIAARAAAAPPKPKSSPSSSPSPSPSPAPSPSQEAPKGPTVQDVIRKMFQLLVRMVMDQVTEDHAQLERNLKDHLQKVKELDRQQ